MPNEETTTRRRRRSTNVTSETSPLDFVPLTPTEVMPTEAITNQSYSPLALPEEIALDLPDFAGSAASAIGFSPNPSLVRVTDAQRVQDERAFREQVNAAMNLRDSIKVATEYISVGIQATKLGKALIQYRTGIADIRTAEVGLQKAQTKTAIATSELAQVQAQLEYNNGLLPQIQAEYQHKLTEAQGRADRARRKAETYLVETENLFPSN